MEAVPATCSRCQQKHHAIPGTTHEGCGGTYIGIQPQVEQMTFSNLTARHIFMMLDRLVADCNICAGQFKFMGQLQLSQAITNQFTAMAIKLRDEFKKQDQSAIVVVGPNGVPRS